MAEDMEQVLRKLKVKRWQQKAVDSQIWVSVIIEAKAVRGP
jgi:hypothetical protein